MVNDYQARLLAILSEMTIEQLRLMELFVEWLVKEQSKLTT